MAAYCDGYGSMGYPRNCSCPHCTQERHLALEVDALKERVRHLEIATAVKTPPMRSVFHTPTGETALIRAIPDRSDIVMAQFDRLEHKHANGWHIYPHADFKVSQ